MFGRLPRFSRRLGKHWPAGGAAIRRDGWRGVAAVLLGVLGLVLVAGIPMVRVDTSTESFLPAGDPAMAAVEQKARDFGGDPVIVMLRYSQNYQFVREGRNTQALLRAEESLAQLPDVAAVYGPGTVLKQLADAGHNFILSIVQKREAARAGAEEAARAAGRSPADVAQAGQAALTEVNVRYAPLLVYGFKVGLPTLSNPSFTQTVLFGDDGQTRPNWRFIVPSPDTAVVLVRPREDLDQDGTQRLVQAIRDTVAGARLDTTSVTVSGVPTVTASLAGEVAKQSPLIGALVAFAVLLRYLLVPAPGNRWQRLRPLVASLLGSAATVGLFGWSGHPLSFGAVVLLPLLLGIGSSFPLYLAAVPNRRRIVVMSVASSVAFLALALSPLPFVRDLGYALCLGVLATVGVALLLNRYWPPSAAMPEEPAPRPAAMPEEPAPRPAAPPAPRAAGIAAAGSVPRAARIGTAVLASALALVGWVALPRVNVAANPTDLAAGLPALNDASIVESALGASAEISVRLSGPDTLSADALRWASATQDVLATRFAEQLRPVVGVPNLFGFLGPDPTPGQVDSAVALIPPYLSSSIVKPDRSAALLMYGVRLQDLGAQQRMLRDVTAALPPPPPGFKAEVVGLPVAAARGYQLLLDDRYLANLAGIVIAGLVLALGLRRRWDAARAVAAALLATGWGLGVIWALGLALSPLTIGLGSLVSVTGCEFVALLTEARRTARRWLWRSVGIACATSVLGYLALVPSRLWVVREFGLVLGAAVVLSYLAAKLVVWLVPRGPPRLTRFRPADRRTLWR